MEEFLFPTTVHCQRLELLWDRNSVESRSSNKSIVYDVGIGFGITAKLQMSFNRERKFFGIEVTELYNSKSPIKVFADVTFYSWEVDFENDEKSTTLPNKPLFGFFYRFNECEVTKVVCTLTTLVKVTKHEPLMDEYDFRVKLFEDIKKLFRNPVLQDVVIRAADGRQFPAHKLILSARSRVFEKLFTNASPSQLGLYGTTEFNGDVMQEILRYIYTGQVKRLNNLDSIISIDEAAKRYELIDLVIICEQLIRLQLGRATVENVKKIMEFAGKHGLHSLRTAAEAAFAHEINQMNRSIVLEHPSHTYDWQGIIHQDLGL